MNKENVSRAWALLVSISKLSLEEKFPVISELVALCGISPHKIQGHEHALTIVRYHLQLESRRLRIEEDGIRPGVRVIVYKKFPGIVVSITKNYYPQIRLDNDKLVKMFGPDSVKVI